MKIKIRTKDDPVAHSFEEEILEAEAFGDLEYQRKLEILGETLGALGFPTEVDREWIKMANLRYREDKKHVFG